MKVSLHQPNYIPYCGLFSKIKQADVHIFYDTAQYSKGDWHNRNRILTKNGEVMLTLPVVGLKSGMTIKEVSFDERILDKHWQTISQTYGKKKYFPQYALTLQDLYLKIDYYKSLSLFNRELTEYLCYALGIETKLLCSSAIKYEGTSNDAIISMVRFVGGDEYIYGSGSVEYLDERKFNESGIKATPSVILEPKYENYDFSILDLLFSQGKNAINYL